MSSTGKIAILRDKLIKEADAYGVAAEAVESDSEIAYRILDAKQETTLKVIAILDSVMKG